MKKATDEQILAIIRIAVSGGMGFDEAQAILDDHATSKDHEAVEPGLEACNVTPPSTWIQFKYLETKFPGCGARLESFLSPFRNWEPKLQPLDQDRIDRACQRRMMSFRSPIMYQESQEQELRLRLQRRLDLQDDEGARMYKLECLQKIDEMPGDLVPMIAAAFATSPPARLSPFLREALYKQLAVACYDLIGTDINPENYAPFFDLWLHGNYPLGRDEKGNALILVAD